VFAPIETVEEATGAEGTAARAGAGEGSRAESDRAPRRTEADRGAADDADPLLPFPKPLLSSDETSEKVEILSRGDPVAPPTLRVDALGEPDAEPWPLETLPLELVSGGTEPGAADERGAAAAAI